MTRPFYKQFTDGQGKIFGVTEVVQTTVGLTVYYYNDKTKEEYSCLIDAFSERFKEIQND